MEAAPDAQAVDCAYVSLALPEVVDGFEQRLTNAQATSAWGTPARILLRCGVPAPPPTDERCISINGIDWIEDPSEAPTYRYTTYGRTPSVEVTIDASPESGASGTAALVDLEEAVAKTAKTGGCVGAEDLLAVPGESPAATGSPTPAEPATSTPTPTTAP